MSGLHDLVGTPAQLGWIVLRTLAVYLFLVLGFRVTGKREVGQLQPLDFALILLIANAVQNAMVGSDTSLLGGLVAAAALLVANRLFSVLRSRSARLQRLVEGRARLLVYHGRIDQRAMHEEGISHEDLMQALRENGLATVHECKMVVLEVDGKISVITAPAPEHQSAP